MLNFFFKNILSVDMRHESFSVAGVARSLRYQKVLNARRFVLGEGSHSGEKAKREEISSGLEEFFKENGTNWDEVIVILPRRSVLYRRVWFPSTVKGNLPTAIDFEVENISPFNKEDILYDYKVVEHSPDGSKVCVLLNLVKRKYYEDIVSIFKTFSLRPTAIISSPAAWEGLDWLFKKNGQTDIFLLLKEEGDLVLNRYSPEGLRESGLHERAVNLPESFKEPGTEEDGLPPFFLWGDGLDDCEKQLTEEGVKTFKVLPSQFYEHFNYKDTEIFNEDFIPAICASEVTEKAPNALNFIPLKDRPKKGKLAYYILLTLVSLIFLSLILLSVIPPLKQFATIDQLENKISGLTGQVDEITKSKDEIKASLSRLKEVEKIQDINPLDVLKELTVLLPEHTWLTYFRQRAEAIEVGGISESATSLISIIESSSIFKDVSFSSPVIKNREGTESFRMKMYLE
jgi:Tfp pilus assembly protein PilN